MSYCFKKSVFKILISIIFSFVFSSCTLRSRHKADAKNSGQTDLVTNVKTTTLIVNDNMKANELSDVAEQLVTPYTFMYAQVIFDLALEKDPHQVKALFYKSLLKRYMIFKGILTRIRPLVESLGNIKLFDEKIKNTPETPLKQFLLDGQTDLTTTYAAQSFLVEYVRAVNYFREYLIMNPELNTNIQLNRGFFDNHIQQFWGKSCHLISETEFTSKLKFECNADDISIKKVNTADLLVLRQEAAAEILALSPITSYSLADADQLYKNKNFDKLPYETQIQLIRSKPQFATLRADHTLGLWPTLAQDFESAYQMAKEIQSELCPKGFLSTQTQRPENLFSKGICFSKDSESERQKVLSSIDFALKGSMPFDILLTDKTPYHTDLDPLALSRQPINDLKLLIPNVEPKCKQVNILRDPTVKGFFPHGDAVTILSTHFCRD